MRGRADSLNLAVATGIMVYSVTDLDWKLITSTR